MIRATVFNFVKHDLDPAVLPFAHEYNIIECKILEGNYSRSAPFLAKVSAWLDKMIITPGWNPMDRVFVIYPLEQNAQFAVSLLNYALAGMGLQPVVWLEISETRGLYLDMNDFFTLGFEKGLAFSKIKNSEMSPIIKAQVDGLLSILEVTKEKKI